MSDFENASAASAQEPAPAGRRSAVSRRKLSPATPAVSSAGSPAPSAAAPTQSFAQKFAIPLAIIFGALVISLSILVGLALPKLPPNQAAAPAAAVPPSGTSATVSVAATGPSLGSAAAPVTIIEFGDFQCPFCRAFWRDTLPQLTKNYLDTGKARLVYRNFPLTQLHPSAQIAATAGECALEQNEFWQMHDEMFRQQDKQGPGTVAFTAADLKAWAKTAGLNTARFNACLDAAKYQTVIQTDLADGAAAGVGGTPTFFINGRTIVGAQPYAIFAQAIDSALAK